MNTLSKIIVVNDRLDGIEPALSKAALLEHYTAAEVEVAEVIWDYIEEQSLPDVEKANLIEAFVAADRHALNRMLEPYRERIAWSEARVLWNKRPDEAMLQEARSQRADLLIKPGVEHSLGDYLHAPLDWRLIRESACPVLISKSNTWQTGGSVLAAVDVADQEHAELTNQILENANLIATTLGAQLHVVCVYSDLGQSVNALQVAMDYDGIKKDMRETREKALAQVLNDLDMKNTIVHVEEGKPANVIANLANQLTPTVTVMGTAARKGLGKVFVGNTAEDTLNRLSGDVLTVRAG
jgi:nucleotide-binding universal stress UspA family protein